MARRPVPPTPCANPNCGELITTGCVHGRHLLCHLYFERTKKERPLPESKLMYNRRTADAQTNERVARGILYRQALEKEQDARLAAMMRKARKAAPEPTSVA